MVFKSCLFTATVILIFTLNLLAEPGVFATTVTSVNSSAASYRVNWTDTSVRKLTVTATLPVNGKSLLMDQTRPGNIPGVGDNGWPELVRNLTVLDESGRPLALTRAGSSGWALNEPKTGVLKLSYDVDYTLLAQNGFPAPREAGFSDASNFVIVGRSLFITSEATRDSTVHYEIPSGWNAVMPWAAKSKNTFTVPHTNELTENFLVFTKTRSDVVTVGKFNFSITPLGDWQNVRGDITNVLRKAVPVYARFVGNADAVNYSIILLPMHDDDWAGESYRGSFVMSAKETPASSTRNVWGQMIAHEIFHYWNGWRLEGKEYASSQWFQEGFTQYAADMAMVKSGMFTEEGFRNRIAEHITNYRKLATTLENPGTHKGRPLYSGGALVALCWDIEIRNATGGRRDITDFFRNLWLASKQTGGKYDWSDIKKALNATAPLDWESFYSKYIKGTEKLPLPNALKLAGLEILDNGDSVQISANPKKGPNRLWDSLTGIRN